MPEQLQEEQSQVEKEMQAVRESALQKEQVRLSPAQLADILQKEGKFELSSNQVLVLFAIDTNDFLQAIGTSDLTQRLQVLGRILNRYSLDLILEGSVTLGEFNIVDHSWSIFPGASGSLAIKAKPSLVRRSISDLVAFLNMLPIGQGFALKVSQDLLLEGLSSDSMLDYYKYCQENESAALREKGQDELFEKNCPMLSLKGYTLKIYGLNATQVDRGIEVNAGGILFRPIQADPSQKTALVVALIAKPTNG